MGFFSWMTADTKESIPNTAAYGAPNHGKTVYMLLSDGEAPVAEPRYDGYGNFGHLNAYEWLAARNANWKDERFEKWCELDDEGIAELADTFGFAPEKLRETVYVIGVNIDTGSYIDTGDGKAFVPDTFRTFDDIRRLVELPEGVAVETFASWDRAIIGGKTPNELAEEGFKKPLAKLYAKGGDVRRPLKFSFDPEAVYEELPLGVGRRGGGAGRGVRRQRVKQTKE